jgi:hypothetical protein
MKNNNYPSHIEKIAIQCEDEIKKEIQNEYGDHTNVWKVNTKLKGIFISWDLEYDCPNGAVWGIDESGNKVILFDVEKHGYEGQFGIAEVGEDIEERELEFEKGTDKHEFYLACQYCSEDEAYAEYIQEGKSKNQADYFEYVIIYSKLGRKLNKIIEFECA